MRNMGVCIRNVSVWYAYRGVLSVYTLVRMRGICCSSAQVDINGSREGHLSTVAFLNATRQYNPSLEIGSVVLCAVACSHPNYDIMLTCISTDDTKGWSTKETYLGELKEGHTFTVPVHYAEMLLGHNCALCDLIGEKVACEIVVGTNGRVHVNSASPALTVAIANVIEKAENVGNFQEMQTLVQQTFQSRLDAINIHSDDDD